jgi:hypothetical protein
MKGLNFLLEMQGEEESSFPQDAPTLPSNLVLTIE